MLQLVLCSQIIIVMWTTVVSHSFNTVLLLYRVTRDSKFFRCLASYSGYARVRIASSAWQCFSEPYTYLSFQYKEKKGVAV